MQFGFIKQIIPDNPANNKTSLNSSYLTCPVGGTVTIIIDDAIAQQAAEMISSNNGKEILAQSISKFLGGLVGGLTGGANIPGVVMGAGFNMYFESSKSNQPENLKEDMSNSGIQAGAGVAWSAKDEGMLMQEKTKHNQAVQRQATELSTESILRRASGDIAGAERYAIAEQFAQGGFREYSPFKFGVNLGTGLAGAVVGFGIDYVSNKIERGYEDAANKAAIKFDNEDKNTNTIGVVAEK